jgi:hypothetical protein
MSYAQKDLAPQVRGDTWIIKFILKDSSGNPINITGNQYWFTLKDDLQASDAQAPLQLGPIDITGQNAIDGIVTFVAPSNITSTLVAKTYTYDFQEVKSTGDVSTIIIGKVKVVKDVTGTNGYGVVIVDDVPVTPIEFIGSITKDITGFVDRTDSTLTFNNSTRTITLTPIDGSYDLYYRGKKFTITNTLTKVITNIPGGRYIKFNPITQQLDEGGSTPSLIDDLLVAYVYWNGSSAIVFGDERHSASRDTNWHQAQHLNVGSVWRSGGVLTATYNNASLVSLGLSNLVIADEDVIHNINHSATPALSYEQVLTPAAIIPVLYLNGTSYTQSTPSSIPWVHINNVPQYNPVVNSSGSLSNVNNNRYVSYWLLGTSDMYYPVKLLLGNVQHQTEKDALAEVFTNYGLPFPEFVPLYKIVLKYNTGYTANPARVQIISASPILTRQSTALGIAESVNITESYVNAGTFNTSTGELVLTGTGSAGATVDLDGRYVVDTTGKIQVVGTNIILSSLPTADPLVAGALWNNGGILRISSG